MGCGLGHNSTHDYGPDQGAAHYCTVLTIAMLLCFRGMYESACVYVMRLSVLNRSSIYSLQPLLPQRDLPRALTRPPRWLCQACASVCRCVCTSAPPEPSVTL